MTSKQELLNFFVANSIQIDSEDIDLIYSTSPKWALLKREVAGEIESRVTAWVAGCTVYLHRVIMNCPERLVVDHINGDTLDNRKENLRICTQAENTRNRKPNGTKGFKGISIRPNGKFRARITSEGIMLNIGDYFTHKEAVAAYNRFALLLHGKFARLNEENL